jgi:hypothetical protein
MQGEVAMSEVVRLEDRRRNANNGDYPIIKKMVVGKLIECVNLDTLTPAQYAKYISQFPEETR